MSILPPKLVFKKIIHSSKIYFLIVQIIKLKHFLLKKINTHSNLQITTNEEIKKIDSFGIIDISLNSYDTGEFVVNYRDAYEAMKHFKITASYFNILLRIKSLKKVTLYISDRNHNFYKIILHMARYNAEGNFNLKQLDLKPTTINQSLFIGNTYTKIKTRNEMKFPVDVLYTYADQNSTHGSQSRYNNIDDLRYSLRSLEANTKFIRNVFVVVGKSPPAWLNTEHNKIKVIRHKDFFFYKDHLPTYNSHAIESQIGNIKDLSEHFIYMNDDVFFLNTCHINDFFYSNGVAKQFISKDYSIPFTNTSDKLIEANQAGVNCQRLIMSKLNKLIYNKYQHAPFALRKKSLTDACKVFETELNSTFKSKYRSKTDLSTTSCLYNYYSYLKRESIPSKISCLQINIDSPMMNFQVLKLLINNNYKILCLNEQNLTHNNKDDIYKSSKVLLNCLFPIKSEYEK